jgi:hypothetical protein
VNEDHLIPKKSQLGNTAKKEIVLGIYEPKGNELRILDLNKLKKEVEHSDNNNFSNRIYSLRPGTRRDIAVLI